MRPGVKRLGVFLLLFAGGMGLLRLVQGPSPANKNGGGPGPHDPWEAPAGDGVPGFTPGGALQVRRFLDETGAGGRRPTRFQLDALDTGASRDGKTLVLTGVTALYLDPETGAPRMELKAKRATVQRIQGAEELFPEIGNELHLEEVTLVLHEGAPVVPLTVRVPAVEVDLSARTLRTDEHVVLEGPRLTGTGDGLFFDETARVLRIERNGDVQVPGESARLRSVGPLELERDPDDPAQLVLRAAGGAHLLPNRPPAGGDPDEGLSAERIVLHGRDDGAGKFVFTSLDAEGGIRYLRGARELEGERTHIELDEQGLPRSARVQGAARARLSLEPGILPGQVTGDERHATVSSEELALEWLADGVHVEAAGPAKVSGAGAELSSDGAIRGVVAPGGERAVFIASEGVRLERADAVLVTREVESVFEHDAEGRSVLSTEARGRPLVTGTTADGRQFVVSSEGSLALRQVGSAWTIPSAQRVELTVLGAEGFRARAENVQDFDPASFSLTARGRVEIETAQGLATGEELTVASRDRFTLTGSPGQKAVFESTGGTPGTPRSDGHAEAEVVEREGERIRLHGAVVGHFEPSLRGGEVYDLSCEDLTLVRHVTPGADGGTLRAFDVEANGLKEARVRSPREELELVGQRLVGAFAEQLDAAGTTLESSSTFTAEAVERAVLVRSGERELRVRLSCHELSATRRERLLENGKTEVSAEAVARGDAAFSGSFGEIPFTGLADEVSLDAAGKVRASAAGEGTVFFSGLMPSNGRPFEMEARWVEASEERIEAYLPSVEVHRMQSGIPGEADVDIRASAQHMTSTTTWLEFEDDVHVDGITEQAIPWTLDAGKVRFEGTLAATGAEKSEVSSMVATRGVVLSLPDRNMRATGELLRAGRLTGLMRLEGVPAKYESEAVIHEADWIEIDINLGFIVGSGKGRFRPPDEEDSAQEESQAKAKGKGKGHWTIEYQSMRTLVEPDSLITVLQEPRVRYEGNDLQVFLPVLPANAITVRASWAVLWVDREEWSRLPEKLKERQAARDAEQEAEQAAEQAAPQKGPARPERQREGLRFFEELREFGVLNEVYLEGPVEVEIQGQPSAFASAVYLDIVSGNGWLADVSFTIDGELLGLGFKKVKVQAHWLRQSKETSYHADNATISLCEFDKPHMLIKTGDLRISRKEDDKKEFNVRLRNNSIRIYDLFTLPLPSIDVSSDEKGKPLLSTLKVGNSARFGSFVSAGFARPASGAAEFFHDILPRGKLGPDIDTNAEYSVDASWLGSRGVLLDFGFLVEAKKKLYWLTEVGGVPDSHEDKGYIQVPQSDRPGLRTWARTNARYWFSEDHWLDAAGTLQSDAGVQSEFFESDFEKFEKHETYLRWRLANGLYYASATAEARVQDFFSEVTEMPSGKVWRGRGELFPLGHASLVYSADASASYLKRFQSDGGYASPFGLQAVFPDGLGDREVLRFDTTQRFEVPFDLGFGGVRATPFALGRFTAWDEDTLQEDDPMRALAQAGVRVSATYWKPAEGGGTHQLAPYVQLRDELALEEHGGEPVTFDEVELPVGGDFLDVGMRGRLAASGGTALLDVDLRASHASDAESGVPDGWNELAAFSRLSIRPFGTPVQVMHDGRYDADTGDTLYSRLSLGLRPTEALGLEASHQRGLDLDHDPLFEAASIAGLYTWTEKWEFEGRQTFSLLDHGDRLSSGFILRRYGHDIVFEVETSFREGEGASFGISVRPLFGFDRPEKGTVGF